MFKKASNDWQGINDDVNYVQHNKNRFKRGKLLAFLSALVLAIAAASTGGYFFIESMVKALNFEDFKTPDVDLEGVDFRVNMDLVPIVSSDKNLRLNYFENSLKVKAFDYLKKLSWWKLLFSTNPDDFDFTWYKPKSDIKLGPVDVSRDGIDPCDLQLTVKSSNYSFRVHIGSFIYNNAKFYEKFMIFNRFETEYNNVDNDFNPIANNIANKGYLSQSYSLKNTDPSGPYNQAVYQWINRRIDNFSTNESQEIVSESGTKAIYPILTSIPANLLKDIDIQDPSTLLPYISLIDDPTNTYFDQDGNYQKLTSSSTFSIIYSPIPDLIEKIINARITDVAGLENFLKNNRLNFIPFVQNNEAITPSSAGSTVRYTTPHNFISQGDDVTKELTKYIYYASNSFDINNFKFDIDTTVDRNIATLNIFLRNQVLDILRGQFSVCRDAVELDYPDTNPTASFNYLISSIFNFRGYFNTAFNNDPSVGRITYYDENNLLLNLDPSLHPIPFAQIKHFGITFGPNIVSSSPYGSQSFSFFFKTFWI